MKKADKIYDALVNTLLENESKVDWYEVEYYNNEKYSILISVKTHKLKFLLDLVNIITKKYKGLKDEIGKYTMLHLVDIEL